MKINKILTAIIAGMLCISCGNDFLTTESASRVPSGSAPDSAMVLSNLVTAYNYLLKDNYMYGYNSLLFTSDLRSDDIFKGGDGAGDQAQLYALATFTSSPSNNVEGLWRIFYEGISKTNNTLVNADIAIAGGVNATLINRYKAEALLLRAYYYQVLWKYWGNIPYFNAPLQEPFVAPQHKADDIYTFIMDDIKAAEDLNSLPMTTKNAELGRLNLATLYMVKARVVMYQKDESKYGECADNMATIIKSGLYDLLSDFDAIWKDENEFCIESIFEANHQPDGGEWAGQGQGYGTNLPAFISPSELQDPSGVFKGGWGFGPVRPELWNSLFESGDTRREASINDWRTASYNERFQDAGFYMRKYAARVGYNPYGTTDLNYSNNVRLFRYAETLLNYAELSLKAGEKQGVSARECLDKIRRRAFGTDRSIPVNLENIKMERHREFIGEGIRFWDLIRWGDAVSKLSETYNGQTLSGKLWSWTRTFTEEKKYLPIPENEINSTKGTAYPLEQNPGWGS
jgi:hypothetical protein